MNILTLKCKAVANYIIEEINKYNEGKSLCDKVSLSTKRLQKLIYFSEIEYMKQNNGKILFDDIYYTWPSGPIIPKIYSYHLKYQTSQQKISLIKSKNDETLDINTTIIIDHILENTKNLDTIDLVNISKLMVSSHNKSYNENDSKYEQIISKNDIYEFYKDRELFSQLNQKRENTKKLVLKKNK